jgi:hypothetical protein
MATRRRSYQNLIPEPITRILALHGAAQVACGKGPRRVSVAVHCAPFDDLLVLFVPARSPILAGLERDPQLDLHVQGGETNYTVRMQGRGIDTGASGGHARRMELVPWLPEGSTLQRFHAVELVPERIEYAFDEGEERRYYQGTTAAADTPGAAGRWLRLCFGGLVPAVAVAFLGLWAWIGWYGQWYMLRPVALLLSLSSCLALVAAARIMHRLLGHRSWQKGKVPRHMGSMLSEGLLPVRRAVILAAVLAVGAAAALIFCGVAWGPELAGITIVATQLWLLVPLWVLRFGAEADKGAA